MMIEFRDSIIIIFFFDSFKKFFKKCVIFFLKKNVKTKKIGFLPLGGEGLGRPNEAMLQLALLPSITGFGLAQALFADSGS